MKKILDRYNIVSFDMFDTLVTRIVKKPTDVFDIVQSKYNKIHKKSVNSFKENRINAEKEAYTNLSDNVEEITLDKIYLNLEKYYSKKTCNELKRIELEVEYDVCVPNIPVIKKYYNYFKLNKKRILITSDMYLPEAIIKKILNKCCIEYDYLYLSNNIGKKKRYSLFEYVVEHEKINKKELLHIGDNLIIDYLSPVKRGIKAIKIKKKKYKNNLNKFIDIFSDNDDYYFRFGYMHFGPILLGYSKYINNSIPNQKKYFLSRDGYIMKLAYETIYGKNKNNIYMYASRRSLIVPTLWVCENYIDMFSKFTIKDKLTINQAFNILGLDDEIIGKYLTSEEREITINKKELFTDNFQEDYKKLIKTIKSNSKKEYINLCMYLKSIDFKYDSNIIDIGWNGNMQLALCKLFELNKTNPNVNGFYVGIDKNSKNVVKIKMNGYLFDEKRNLDIFYSEKSINNLFESFFLAPHGTVIKYENNNPVLAEYEYTENEAKIYTRIQDGAIKFLTDVVNNNVVDYLCINSNESYNNMKNFSYKPSLNDIKKFGNIQFYDNGLFYIAKPKSIIFYMIHPKMFIQDLQMSGWMIGFMKRLTKINIGYKMMFIMMFKKYEKRYNKEKTDEKN